VRLRLFNLPPRPEGPTRPILLGRVCGSAVRAAQVAHGGVGCSCTGDELPALLDTKGASVLPAHLSVRGPKRAGRICVADTAGPLDQQRDPPRACSHYHLGAGAGPGLSSCPVGKPIDRHGDAGCMFLVMKASLRGAGLLSASRRRRRTRDEAVKVRRAACCPLSWRRRARALLQRTPTARPRAQGVGYAARNRRRAPYGWGQQLRSAVLAMTRMRAASTRGALAASFIHRRAHPRLPLSAGLVAACDARALEQRAKHQLRALSSEAGGRSAGRGPGRLGVRGGNCCDSYVYFCEECGL
jgi:hypothetical protein